VTKQVLQYYIKLILLYGCESWREINIHNTQKPKYGFKKEFESFVDRKEKQQRNP